MSERNKSYQTARPIAEVIRHVFETGPVPTGVEGLDEHVLHYMGNVCLVHGHHYAARWLLLAVLREALAEGKSVVWVDLRESKAFSHEVLALLANVHPDVLEDEIRDRPGHVARGLKEMRALEDGRADFEIQTTHEYFDAIAEQFDVVVVPDLRACLKIAREGHEGDLRSFAEWGAAYLRRLSAEHGTLFYGQISGDLEDRWTYAADTVLRLERPDRFEPVCGVVQKARHGRQGGKFELPDYKVREPKPPEEELW